MLLGAKNTTVIEPVGIETTLSGLSSFFITVTVIEPVGIETEILCCWARKTRPTVIEPVGIETHSYLVLSASAQPL